VNSDKVGLIFVINAKYCFDSVTSGDIMLLYVSEVKEFSKNVI